MPKPQLPRTVAFVAGEVDELLVNNTATLLKGLTALLGGNEDAAQQALLKAIETNVVAQRLMSLIASGKLREAEELVMRGGK